MSVVCASRFPSPFEVSLPPEAEGWEEMYPYYYVFSEGRRAYEESKFWYRDSLHHPEPLYPFDAITAESWWVGLGEYNSRVFVLPPAMGLDQRLLGGYLYVSPNAVSDPVVIAERVRHFRERAGYYYNNWEELYGRWVEKARAAIEELAAIPVPSLPETEAIEVVTAGRGLTSAFDLLQSYDRVIESMYRIWHYHFELLNLGYTAYLSFFEFCKRAFPSIPDQNIARMVSGIDVILFRPDEELKRLAGQAVSLGLSGHFEPAVPPPDLLATLGTSETGRRWLEDFERAKQPWFNFSMGSGFSHTDRSWIDDLSVPLRSIREYVRRLLAGEEIARPLARIREERDRLSVEYRELLSSEEDRTVFQELLALARRVFPYIEEHNFYVEHWHHTLFWNKMREFDRLVRALGFVESADDIFFLTRFELGQALYDAVTAWASGGPARGRSYWPVQINRRKVLHAALKRWSPPQALGQPPAVIAEPFTVMLWGVTNERLKEWLMPPPSGGALPQLFGAPASPGVAEGPARVLEDVSAVNDVRAGEVLVCTSISPGWTPAFRSAAAVVTDIGGMMSHAAIVCREYGIPSVVGTGAATSVLKTGQLLRVDGTRGIVQVLG